MQAKAVMATGGHPGLAQIHAMKFYSMAQALNHLFALDRILLTTLLGGMITWYRDVIERNLMPTVLRLKLVH